MSRQRATKFYRSIRWGRPEDGVVELGDLPFLPEWTSVLGKAHRLKTQWADLGGRQVSQAHVIVDPSPRRELWVVGVARPRGLERFERSTLPAIARKAGGRRGRLYYPNLEAYDLGPMTDIDYYSHKGDEGLVLYLHEVLDRGEGKPRARHRCHLAYAPEYPNVLWIVGGDYTVTAHGIVG